MSDIIKICSIHGELTKDKVRINKINSRGHIPIICRECSNSWRREYYKNNKDKLRSAAEKWKIENPQLAKEAKKKWQISNRERCNEVQRRYVDKNRENINFKARVREYGITLDEYQIIRDRQNNKCVICFKEETKIWRGKTTELCLDHDHKTGKLRQLLCFSCNIGLGAYKDDIQLLKNAISYLERHKHID